MPPRKKADTKKGKEKAPKQGPAPRGRGRGRGRGRPEETSSSDEDIGAAQQKADALLAKRLADYEEGEDEQEVQQDPEADNPEEDNQAKSEKHFTYFSHAFHLFALVENLCIDVMFLNFIFFRKTQEGQLPPHPGPGEGDGRLAAGEA